MTDKKNPGPDPERLKIEGDPGAALDRLLGKRDDRGGWQIFGRDGQPDHRRPVEYELEGGERVCFEPGNTESTLRAPSENRRQAVRWRYLDE